MGRLSTMSSAEGLGANSAGVATRAGAASLPTIADLIECTKPGITRMVTITALVGFVLAALGAWGGVWSAAPGSAWGTLDVLVSLVGCVLGTAFSAAGANALNMWSEHARDACMERTASRPIPSGRVSPRTAFWLGTGLSTIGVVGLWLVCGPLASLISLACVVTYLLLYTPMKVASPLSTLVGAIPGALPPLIGWYAVGHALSAGAAAGGSWLASPIGHAGGWALFGLMFVWQMPHFMAIAWKYREHYEAGGYRVLSVGDATGARTAASMLRWTLLLLPATLLPALAMPGLLGGVTIVAATLTGLGFLWLVLEFGRERTAKRAKAVFLASIAHLPLLLLVMVGEAGVRVLLGL
ncbi:MAG: protoheme IX farnesyltransferase [Phycisphaerales bacterium]|nr:protoheme IX farnesyltransferase [Phycisphaerales bacterium]MCB9841206.1 protoheme IX farnesyltransferase [Phycisphaeraceae bacterium]